MKSKTSKVLAYMYMPVLYALIGYSMIYFAGKPVIDIAQSVAGMVFVGSTKNLNTEFKDIYNPSNVTEGTIEMSEVEYPTFETLYANISSSDIGLDAPIYFGDSEGVFDKGAGQYLGSYIPGLNKPILLGGHDNTFFAPLEQAKEGEIIKVQTSYGVFEYEVTGTKIANANDASAYDLASETEELILYTCYPFGSYIGLKDERYYVYAKKISGPTVELKEDTSNEAY